MVIDAYAHVFPTVLIDALARVKPSKELAALRAQSRHNFEHEARLAYMDEHGFDVQVLILARPPVWLGMERDDIHRLTRIANESIAEFAGRRPDRFAGVGVLPVVDDVMMAELERIHGELGLKGVLIFSNIEGKPLDDESMWPLYERAAELDFPIWIHPQHANYYPWIRKDVLDRALAWPFDTSLAMARLVYGGVFERFPNIKFVTHHMGGMIPYFAGRIAAFAETSAEEYAKLGLGESGPKLTGPPLDHFKRFYNDCISNGSPIAVKVALDFFGPDHILFGTDFPFGPDDGERWPLDELRTIKTMPMDERDREKILFRNAQKLLKLPAPASTRPKGH
jgi:predicted TIM-barrel fold metal-dependent hydrolase